MQGYDKGTIKHMLNVLWNRSGNQIIWYAEDLELEYKTSIAATTTVTFTEIPTTCKIIFCSIHIYNGTGSSAYMGIKRRSSSTNKFYYSLYTAGATTAYKFGAMIIPTYQNQIYIDDIGGTVDQFKILGYSL